VEPGTRFCGGCGQQLAVQGDAPDAQARTVTVQSPAASFGGYQAPSAFSDSTAPLPAPTPLPPPAADTRQPWPPPPSGTSSSSAPPPPPPPPAAAQLALPPANGQPGPEQAPLSDTMERMLRPQGLFQSHLPKPVEWPQPQGYPPPGQPAPGAYPPGAQYPPGGPYPQDGQQYPHQGPPPAGGPYPAPGQPPPPGQYPPQGQNPPQGQYSPPGQYPPQAGQYPPPGGQYPPTGSFQQAAPQAWAPAPTTSMPTAGGQTPFPGSPQPGASYPPGGPYPPGAQFPPGAQYPPGPQAPGAPGGAPYGGQFAGGQQQFGQEQFAPGQFGPAALVGPGSAPPGDDGKPGPASRLPFKLPQGRNWLIPVAVAGVLIVIVVAGLVLASQGGGSNGGGAGTGASGTATQSAPASGSSGLTQEQAATALSGLLAQSGTDHSDVNAAVTDVEACGSGLASDAKEFNTAAGNRRALLAKLAQLPGRSALSAPMLADLTSAWQASATVDADLGKWAAAEEGHCHKGGTTKSHDYTATIPFDSKATNGKTEFVELWNPLAKKDGLSTYQAAQLLPGAAPRARCARQCLAGGRRPYRHRPPGQVRRGVSPGVAWHAMPAPLPLP
jgi:hypothetical protein